MQASPLTIEHNTLLVDGKGQGHEGKGHDAWAGFPYTHVNQARITLARLDSDGFDVVGEGAAAYNDSLGLQQYRRRITMSVPGKVEVQDEIDSKTPHLFTEVLHSDMHVEPVAARRYQIRINDAALNVSLALPADATEKVESNIVMGPGRPGSVDKGSPEERGERLLISSPKAAMKMRFVWELAF